jgi:flagellar hook assembly protein FlgD
MTILTFDRTTLASSRTATARVDFVAWLGRDALIAADFVHRRGDGSFAFEVRFDTLAESATIDLLDSQGLIVHTITARGTTLPLACQWHGKGDIGRIAGPLRVRVSARAGGRPVPTVTNVWTPITSIDAPAERAELRLVTPNGLIAPDAVIRLA